MYSVICSQCGRYYRAKTRAVLFELLRVHLWKEHRDWLVERVPDGALLVVNPPRGYEDICCLE